MKQEELRGKVQTVLGIIDAEALGVTLIHEHLLHDMRIFFTEPSKDYEKRLAYQRVQMANLSWIRFHTTNNLDNLNLTSEKTATKEAELYRSACGNTIVDLTNRGAFGRNPKGLARIARTTGLNIIMGTGHNIAASHPPEIVTRTADEIAQEIIGDIMIGVGKTGECAGIIGEIGCSLPLLEVERKVLRSAAVAQCQTGAAIYIHPSPNDNLVSEIIGILRESGADLSRTIIGHIDLMGYKINTIRSVADAGCYIAYDNFGLEGLFKQPRLEQSVELCDLMRINDIINLIQEGYLEQILISHDIATKDRLVSYGGHGYSHILCNIVPIMRAKGISEVQIQALLVENPKRILSFASVR